MRPIKPIVLISLQKAGETGATYSSIAVMGDVSKNGFDGLRVLSFE